MRMLMKVSIPVGAGNKAIEAGTLPTTMTAFIEQMKPEAAYFGPHEGKRTAYFVFDLQDPTMIPVIAEPFFRELEASIEIHPAMNAEEMKAGVAKVSKRGAAGSTAQRTAASAQPR